MTGQVEDNRPFNGRPISAAPSMPKYTTEDHGETRCNRMTYRQRTNRRHPTCLDGWGMNSSQSSRCTMSITDTLRSLAHPCVLVRGMVAEDRLSLAGGCQPHPGGIELGEMKIKKEITLERNRQNGIGAERGKKKRKKRKTGKKTKRSIYSIQSRHPGTTRRRPEGQRRLLSHSKCPEEPNLAPNRKVESLAFLDYFPSLFV
jgi:hypothetical protein